MWLDFLVGVLAIMLNKHKASYYPGFVTTVNEDVTFKTLDSLQNTVRCIKYNPILSGYKAFLRR